MYDKLLQLPLFQGVSRMKMSEIIEKTRFHFLKYQDNEIIAHRGEECTHMKFIVSGSARSELKNISGKIRVSETLHAPNILYPNHLFGRNTTYPCEVTAKENAASAAKTNEIRAESLAAPAKPAEVKTEAEKVPVVPVTAEAAAEKEKPVAGRAKEPVPAETKAVRTAVKAERPAPKAKEAAPAAAKQETIAKGTWQIQLMSSPNKAAVEKSWKTMSAKYKILSGLPHEVSSVDLGAKGTYYRLKAGSFATKAEAAALCGKLKAAGGSCFTARK